MDKCKDCTFYDNKTSCPETGYCILHEDYVRENDNCVDFMGEENED